MDRGEGTDPRLEEQQLVLHKPLAPPLTAWQGRDGRGVKVGANEERGRGGLGRSAKKNTTLKMDRFLRGEEVGTFGGEKKQAKRYGVG